MPVEGATLQYTGTLKVTTCWCGIQLAIPSNLYRRAHDEGVGVYCPVGHAFYFNETANQRLQAQLERERAARERAAQRAQAERELREHTEHKLRAQKGATTKARKRHAAGVCPACKRTFQQLARHMESQHPDFDPAAHG